MDNGFIRLNRKFFDNAYWKQERTFSLSEAWLDLIQLARFEERPANIMLPNGREISIKRGEIRASLRFLSSRWSWGVEKTKKFIDKHIEKKEIERRTEQGESIITLCNYEYYNPLLDDDPNSDRYTDRTVTDTPTRTNNKKVKKEKKDTTSADSGGGSLEEKTLHTKSKVFFESYYLDLFSAAYYWTPKDAVGINQILDKLKFQRKSKKLDNSDHEVFNAFMFFIKHIEDDWVLKNFSIPNINSKYNEIMGQIKRSINGKKENETVD